ncbi:DUF300-domain-containing protein [Pisolithus orientalis]|uniref:DUF300-domain-containing protein n=1 Tax=Pisolithus orientalis TaxID=936130 RepID=UPI0022250A06|nr:DUF300-domain-containing protein [Pisolithus orientalis]KAI6004489.1 DUF300-domain-containing protein [Pisolithus orientalis]
MSILPDLTHGHGAGSSLPLPVLVISGVSTFVAVVVSGLSIWLQLRNYRKPFLQRMVFASLISLFSLEAAFFIDAIRDIYEAFVIYCFFVLLVDYLGGERSLLMMLHGRPPIPAIFPVNLWRSDIDVSDPYTFLFLKRGILQYVQVKPILAFASLIMKATGTYNEGDFRARSGYLYVSIIYNTSICLALWCLAVFWMCVNADLKPFRPVPKFLCVKGILFFSFWQSVIVSSLVAVGAITRLGPYTDNEHISLGLTDTLICFEMPFFAAAHMYAFSYRDFIHPPTSAPQKGGPPIDIVEDTRVTLKGKGINYRAFEPSEGGMHIGAARERRIRAGLRYSAGGKRKYWLPEVRGLRRHCLRKTPKTISTARIPGDDEDVPDDDEKYVFGDYSVPCRGLLARTEARWAMWEEEARVVRESIHAVSGRDESKLPPRGTTRPATNYVTSGERVVDFGEGNSADVSGGVRLGWTNARVKGKEVRSSPLLSSSVSSGNGRRLQSSSRPSSSGSGSKSQLRVSSPKIESSSETHPSVPSVERTSSQKSQSRWFRSKSPRAPLAEDDAVDLIIPTDSHYVPPSRSNNSSHSAALIRMMMTVAELSEPEDIIRAQTPPYYVRNSYEDEGNPWA